MGDAADRLTGIVARNRDGERQGVTSVCCAHPLVIRAALELARGRGQVAVIESTCNQVNQDGGYTGMTPAAFAEQVRGMARSAGLADGDVVLGGDHLGPQPWRGLPAEAAMGKATAMVEAYARAGYAKLHLDCSMGCADDAEPLSDAAIAERAARLAAAAEAVFAETGGRAVYIVGTEVPAPGGMGEGHAIVPTTPHSVRATWTAHERAFEAAGLSGVIDRVVGIVVQPGLDFGNEDVVHFEPQEATALAQAVVDLPGVVYEAHSTDYQLPGAYARLVDMHFAILKVGPAATFALREAVYALEAMAREMPGWDARFSVREAIEAAMQAEPRHWRSHYAGDDAKRAYLRHFSLSDRLRYYWTAPGVAAAAEGLFGMLERDGIPLPLISQFMPQHVGAVAAGGLAATPEALSIATVQAALAPYADACGRH